MLKFKRCITDNEIPNTIVLDIVKKVKISLEEYLFTYKNLILLNDLESVNIKLSDNFFSIKTDLSDYRIDFLELKITSKDIYLVVSHRYTNELYEYYLSKEIDNK
jgi:hypothetical protein